jgi:2-oxoglutarate ferredoxin oxidoreductase subunit gamma
MNDQPLSIRFGGLGGQGLVTLGAVLAEAGARAGLRVAATQAYGSRARGGATRSDVILSKTPIDFPHVIQPDVLAILAQEAYDIYAADIHPQGVILVDAFFVKQLSRTGVRQQALSATSVAMEKIGNKVAANFVMLGAVVGYTGLVPRADAEAAMQVLVNKRFLEINRSAFGLGYEMGQKLPETEVGPWR